VQQGLIKHNHVASMNVIKYTLTRQVNTRGGGLKARLMRARDDDELTLIYSSTSVRQKKTLTIGQMN
jgi:hypothetical protein